MIDIEAIERRAAFSALPEQRVEKSDGYFQACKDRAALLAAHKDLADALALFVNPLDANHEMPCHCRHCVARAALLRARGPA